MRQVFISYGSKDQKKAEELLERLESVGISCWYAPRDILPGENYAFEIPKAIEECQFFAFLLSNEAQNSHYVMLELDQAAKRGKTIIPILVEDVEQNEGTNFLINSSQSVDARKDFPGAVNKVIRTIMKALRAPVPILVSENKCSGWNYKSPVCPHCGCAYVKRHDDRIAACLEAPGMDRKYFRLLGFLSQSIEKETFNLGVLLIFISVCVIAITFAEGLHALISNLSVSLLCGVVLFALLYIWIDESIKAYAAIARVKDAISLSGMRYQSLKCAGCEESFDVLVPNEGELKDWIPGLIETETKQ